MSRLIATNLSERLANNKKSIKKNARKVLTVGRGWHSLENAPPVLKSSVGKRFLVRSPHGEGQKTKEHSLALQCWVGGSVRKRMPPSPYATTRIQYTVR